MLGIPLFLLSIARFSSVLADFFIFIYRYIVCCPCECYSVYSGDGRTHAEDDENDLEEGNRTDMVQVIYSLHLATTDDALFDFLNMWCDIDWLNSGKRCV